MPWVLEKQLHPGRLEGRGLGEVSGRKQGFVGLGKDLGFILREKENHSDVLPGKVLTWHFLQQDSCAGRDRGQGVYRNSPCSLLQFAVSLKLFFQRAYLEKTEMEGEHRESSEEATVAGRPWSRAWKGQDWPLARHRLRSAGRQQDCPWIQCGV